MRGIGNAFGPGRVKGNTSGAGIGIEVIIVCLLDLGAINTTTHPA